MMYLVRRLAGFLLLSASLPCIAGVTVIQNSSPGATSWPATPLVSTVSNPSSQATVAESFNGGGGNTNLSQTFTITTTNYTLQAISLYAGAGTGTGAGTNLLLRLYDLGIQTAPNPSPYTPGTDLFNSGNGLSISYTQQANGILEFDFTGADQVTLQAGHMYAFALSGAANTTPVFWQRGTNDTYSGGAAYRNRAWINNNNARDFALAVYVAGSITNPPVSAQCTVNTDDVRQRIDGFGGGVQFLNPASLDPVSTSVMDTLFSMANTNQLGLTLLRIGIDPNNNWNNQLQDAKKAVARGASILATPWSPPASMKDNGSTISGSLLPTQYTNYANYLNGFAAFMASNGAPLKVISLQNEPDFDATYDSCLWTPTQFQTFCHDVAGLITNALVMMPESLRSDFAMSDPTLNDPVAAANVDIVGGHLYGVTTIQDYTNAHNKGKPTWMTEFLINDQTIDAAIATAKQIHDCLTTANMSAYIWWKALGDANGLVSASGVPQKRGFILAQWSRFVRTNYYRVGTTYDNNAAISAYKDISSNRFAIVAINTNINLWVNEKFNLTNFTADSVTPWLTSGSQSLAVQPAVIVSNKSFTYLLPPQTIVTFVGQSTTTNTPPSLVAIADSTVDAGITLVVTNSAVDPDLPSQVLTFTLLNGPGNATLTTLNSSNALFAWRPLVSQADTTNLIQVQVADNGSPSLSATNSFLVTVNPLGQASLNSIIMSGGQVNLNVIGPFGPDYSLWISTNLLDWDMIFATNSPATPFTIIDTNANDAARFYRLQLGP